MSHFESLPPPSPQTTESQRTRESSRTYPEAKQPKAWLAQQRKPPHRTFQLAADQEAQIQTTQFENKLPQLLALADEPGDDPLFRQLLHGKTQDRQQRSRGASEVESQVAQKLNVLEHPEESQTAFQERFRVLFQQYQRNLPSNTPLSGSLSITPSLLQSLIPGNPALQQAVANELNGREKVSVKELLATTIFLDIVHSTEQHIQRNIAQIHDSQSTDSTPQTQAIHQLLVDLNLRDPANNANPIELSLEDFRTLNHHLNELDPVARQPFLDTFINQMSTTLGIPPAQYREQLRRLLQDIAGLETVKRTFTHLKNDHGWTLFINDNGTLNADVLASYFHQAQAQIAAEFSSVPSSLPTTPIQAPSPEMPPLPPHNTPLQWEQIQADPILTRLAQVNPMFADVFNRSDRVQRILLPNAQTGYEFALSDSQNDYRLSLRLDPQTGQAAILVGDKETSHTPVTNATELTRNLNSALANQAVLNDLKLPPSCFDSQPVDVKELSGLNDPLQLITTILPDTEFPQDTILQLNADTVNRLRQTFRMELGDDYLKATTPSEVKTLLAQRGWLDGKERLTITANLELQATYAHLKRHPSIDTSNEWQSHQKITPHRKEA